MCPIHACSVEINFTGLFLIDRNIAVPSPTPPQGKFSALTPKALKLLVKIKFFKLLVLLYFFTSGVLSKAFLFSSENAALIKLRRLVKRRQTHVGAPDNRIEALYKEYVLTPRGRDMNPELGPVVAASPENRLLYLSGLWQRDFLHRKIAGRFFIFV